MKKVFDNKPLAVFVLFVLACALTFLCGKTRTTYTMPDIEKQKSEGLSEAEPYVAQFTAFHKDLYSIWIEPNEDYETEGSIRVSLCDQYGESLASCERECADLNFGYMNEFELHTSGLTEGETYNIAITAHGCEGAVNLSVTDNTTLLKQMTYKAPITKRGMLPYVMGYALLAILIIAATEGRNGFGRQAKIVCFGLFVIGTSALILMNDEGTSALKYDGTELVHEEGYEDYRGYLSFNEGDNSPGLMCSTEGYILNAGEYMISLSYLTGDASNTIGVEDDGVTLCEFQIDPTATYGEYTFSVDKDTQNTVISIYYGGSGTLKVNELTLKPTEGRSFYTDNYFILILFWALCALGIYIYHRNRRKPIARELLMDNLAIVAIALLGFYPYMTSNLWAADDLAYHMLRIEGLKDAIVDGQLPAVIMPNALSGNGYLNSMYPYLFLYIPALLRIFNVSLVLSYKTLIFLANLATAALTYVGVKSVCDRRMPALLGAMLYVMLPYRFCNIYARGALGETLAMTFLPFLFAAIYHLLLGDKKKWYWIIIALSGLLQCHIISFVIGCVLTAIPCILFMRELLKDKRWLLLIKAGIISLFINLWFLVPFVWFYLKGDLDRESLDWSGFTEYTCDPAYFLNMTGSEDYRYLSFGIPVAVIILLGVVHLIWERKSENGAREQYLRLLYIVGALFTLLLTAYGASDNLMDVYAVNKIFTTIQYPWRLFAYASALFIFAGVIWFAQSTLLERNNLKNIIFVGLIITCAFTGMRSLYKFENYSYENYTDEYTAGHETKVKGYVAKEGMVIYPYEWRREGVDETDLLSIYFVENYETTDIINYEKKGSTLKVDYTATADADIILPVMYYYGYQAVDENGSAVNTGLASGYAMVCELNADGNEHSLIISYKEPAGFVAAMWISIVSVIACAVLSKRKRKA